MKVVHCIQLM
ncbi:hypothetical protein ACMD2_24929 [Ananas comosus]|uniref:Uncharacterized protein n=1 Tax=Ananas comosus TaxID=4615 RepID=A0A199UZ09_ANACO|nr:hypothetical protein ACMD2_24929 [Ananas comosus]